jgi:hypothetical protein
VLLPGLRSEDGEGAAAAAKQRAIQQALRRSRRASMRSAAVERVARQVALSPSTVPALLGKKQKSLTVVSDLETGEPLWLGRERKKETLDEFMNYLKS